MNRAGEPRLILFAGPPCSGKSTLAAAIASRLGLPHLEMDRTRERILPGAAHTRADRAAAYRAMHFAAELLLEAGAGAVLDAPYGHEEDRREIDDIVRRTGARLLLIECRVSPELAVARFRARPRGPRLDLTEESVAAMCREYRYRGSGLTLETSRPPADCITEIEAFLASSSSGH